MSASWAAPPLYLAFLDGVLDHVCAECTAICCKGWGFQGSLKREMSTLLDLYPALGHSVVARNGDVVDVANPGRCFFLGEDHGCDLEKRHGRRLKPGQCLQFPFNVLQRFGRYLVLSPHFACPLRVRVPAAPGHVAGTHETVARQLLDGGLLCKEYVDALPEVPLCDQDEVIVGREVAFRARCAADLGRRSFRDTLRDASEAPQSGDEIQRGAAVLGLPPPATAEPDQIDAILMALAPALRIRLLHLPAEVALVALGVAEQWLRGALQIAQRITVQDCHHILTRHIGAFALLGWGDRLPLTAPDDGNVPSFGSPDLVFSASRFMREMGQGVGVISALETAVRDLRTSDRMALVMQMGGGIDALIRRALQPRPKPSRPRQERGRRRNR